LYTITYENVQVKALFIGTIFNVTYLLYYLSSGPSSKMVSHRLFESSSGEFTVEYTPVLTGTQYRIITVMLSESLNYYRSNIRSSKHNIYLFFIF